MVITQLQRAVSEEIASEPRVAHQQIAVSAEGGVVTLRGTVGSPRQKFEAGQAAKRVYGVQEVKNELEVRILVGDKRDDAELRGAVLQALALNSLVPSTVDAKANDGVVTLTGTVNWQYQREEAELVGGNVPGVRGIRSEIVLIPTPDTADVKVAIKRAIERNAVLDENSIGVDSRDGTVILTGVVTSLAARDEAVHAAWSVPGVTKVNDEILVSY